MRTPLLGKRIRHEELNPGFLRPAVSGRPSGFEPEQGEPEQHEARREREERTDRGRDVGDRGARADQHVVIAVERPGVRDAEPDLLHDVRHEQAREQAATEEAHHEQRDRADRAELLLGPRDRRQRMLRRDAPQ